MILEKFNLPPLTRLEEAEEKAEEPLTAAPLRKGARRRSSIDGGVQRRRRRPVLRDEERKIRL